MNRTVYLDRDGVLNRAVVRDGKPYPPHELVDFELLEGVPDAVARLAAAGFRLVVVTNQPDVARGSQQRSVVEAMHGRLREQLPLDAVLTCWHDDADGCACRKPAPGLLLEDAAGHDTDLAQSWLVGDRWRDVEAGRRAGCRTVFIDHGYAEALRSEPEVRAASLSAAADVILAGAAPLNARRSSRGAAATSKETKR